MRYAVVGRKLYALGINQQQANLRGRLLGDDAGYYGVQANALAAARRARNQQVRHLGEIEAYRFAAAAASERNRQMRGLPHLLELVAGHDVSNGDHARRGVRNLYAHERLAHRGRFDSQRGRLERQRQIGLPLENGADLHARLFLYQLGSLASALVQHGPALGIGLLDAAVLSHPARHQAVHGNRGTGANVSDLDLDVVVGERLGDDVGGFVQLCLGDGVFRSVLEQFDFRAPPHHPRRAGQRLD